MRGDVTVRALDHPYRRSILQVLRGGSITYSELFRRIEPDGGERARFNYHLRSLRNADLVSLTDSLYGLTPGGEAALALLREVSERSEAGARPMRDSQAGERGWIRRVGEALRLRRAKVNAVVPVGRVLLFVGSALLLVSVVLPWFTVSYAVSGSEAQWRVSSHDILPGTVNGFGAVNAIGSFGGGVFALVALVWLILVVAFGMTSAVVNRKFSWIGVSGILVLAMLAIQIVFAASVRGWLSPSFGTPSVSIAYGFILAVVGSALIETGERLKTPGARVVPSRPSQPSVSP